MATVDKACAMAYVSTPKSHAIMNVAESGVCDWFIA